MQEAKAETRYTPQGGTEVQLKKSACKAVHVQLDSRYRLVGLHKLHGNDNYYDIDQVEILS